jgi:hypothetical protein
MPYQFGSQFLENEPWFRHLWQRAGARSESLMNEPYQAYNRSRIAPFNPDLNRAHELGRNTGLNMPYLQGAERFTNQAAQGFPENVNRYMNPYQQQVVNRMGQEGARTLNERIIPALSGQFAGLGQHGSTQHHRLLTQATRQLQDDILGRQQAALASGYQQAGQLHASDQERALQAGRHMSQLGTARQAGNIADISALEQQGERQRGFNQRQADVGYEDFMRQVNHPREALNTHAGMIHGYQPAQSGFGFNRESGQPQPNVVSQLSSLAGNLYGANRAYGGHKQGGLIKKPSVKKPKAKGLGAMSMMQTSMIRHPKVGGKFSLKRGH